MKKISPVKFFGVIFVLYLFCANISPTFAFYNNMTQNSLYPTQYFGQKTAQIMDEYKNISTDESICIALDLLKGTKGDYSRQVILGANPTSKPIKIVFKNLLSLSPAYGNVNALGLKKGSQIYIYINEKHKGAPVISIAALIAHEALHQDTLNSLAEETYAWTTEAIVWGELAKEYPQYKDSLNPLACREKTLDLLYKKGGGTSNYIKTIVYSSPCYQNLPETSPGFSVL